MSIRLRDVMRRHLGDLRHEETEKWIRASVAGRDVLDSTRALLVWEPRRVVPSYAVPLAVPGSRFEERSQVEAATAAATTTSVDSRSRWADAIR